MEFVIEGKVYNIDTKSPIPNLVIQICDTKGEFIEELGSTTTDISGFFHKSYNLNQDDGILKVKPSVYIKLKKSLKNMGFYTSDEEIQFGVNTYNYFEINISVSNFSLIEDKTPTDTNLKAKYQKLVNTYAPVLYFDSQERFYPIDLESTFNASALYKDKDTKISDYGKIDIISDLPSAIDSYFTTVDLLHEKTVISDTNQQITVPYPDLKVIENKFTIGEIKSQLAIYSTVSPIKDIPNYKFLLEYIPRDKQVKGCLDKGVLINYYFYFPALHSDEMQKEGDWAGISVLLADTSSTPTLTCYYKKILNMPSSDNDGFRLWQDVEKIEDAITGIATHPVVYISKGLHNCYYQNVNVNIDYNNKHKWNSSKFKVKESMVENGDYNPLAESPTLIGDSDTLMPWYLYLFFPPFIFFECCDKATGVVTSRERQDTMDSIDKGGNKALPDSVDNKPQNTYPQVGVSKTYKFNTIYVDHNIISLDSMWSYNGFYGSSTFENYITKEYKDGSPTGKAYTYTKGKYGGPRRPRLGAWFIWNLCFDDTYGSGGIYFT